MRSYLVFSAKYLILFLFVSTFPVDLSAQQIKRISYYRHFEYKDGLPENDVKEFYADDQNGYWFRTPRNIVYFSGYDFISYNSSQSLFHISSSAIEAFIFHKGFIYVFGDGGIDQINCTTKQSKHIFKNKFRLAIKGGFVTSSGRIIFITGSGDIYEFKGGKIFIIGKIEYFTNNTIRETPEGHVLVTNGNREIAIYDSSLKLLRIYKFSKEFIITGGLYSFPSYGTVVVLNQASFLYNPKTVDFDCIKNPLLFRRIFYVTNKYFYFIASFNKVIQQDRNTGLNFQLKLTLDNNYYVNDIGVDLKQNIVLCTNQGIVLFKEPSTAFSNISVNDNSKNESPVVRRAIVESDDSSLILITYNSIDRFNPLTGESHSVTSQTLYGYAAQLSGNYLWLGTDGSGIMRVNIRTGDIKQSSFFREVKKGESMHVMTVNKFDDSLILLGTASAHNTLKTYNIYKDSYSDVTINGWPGGKLNQKVTFIGDGISGTKWICTLNGLLQINKNFQLLSLIDKKKLGTEAVNHFYIQKDSICWIATDQGIFVYDLIRESLVRSITTADGLPNNKCLALLPDTFGTLWIPTYNGLARLNTKNYQVRSYYMQDGLPDNEYNFASFLRSRRGDIYLGGLDGYLHIKPFPFDTIDSGKDYISFDYLILHKQEGEKLLELNKNQVYRIHSSDDRLSVVFSLKNHLYSERFNYEYLIEGLQTKWVNLGRQNKLDLGYLPPGDYTLRIRSAGLTEILNAEEIVFSLSVYQFWYESKYFYLVFALLLTLLIFAVINYRYKALQNLGKIKTELANDIHDEIGTILTKAVMKTELLRHKVGATYPEIGAIEQNLREAIFSFRTILWSLNIDNRKLDDFVARLNTILAQTFDHTHFNYVVTNQSPNLLFNKSILVKRNLLLIIKELSHNALKHSSGNLFEVIIQSDGDKWRFLVVDNGQIQQPKLAENGLGLKSIQHRVNAINGKIAIQQKKIGFYVNITL